MNLVVLYELGLALVVIGIMIIVVAIIFASKYGPKKAKVRVAGVIMIGPIPIIFGSDKKAVKNILVLALAITIMVFIFSLVYYWLLR